jgi:hypothetical protein
MKELELPIIVNIFFIFNIRVNPDNTDGAVSIRHPLGFGLTHTRSKCCKEQEGKLDGRFSSLPQNGLLIL